MGIMRNTQIAICCALALNLIFIMLVATGTWEFKYEVKKGCDPDCGSQFDGPEFIPMFCNFNERGGPGNIFSGANCESCGKHSTKTDCENDGLPEKGAAECVKVCFNRNDVNFECDNSATCGSSGSTAFCNFDGFVGGFCESCSKHKTKHDCENDGLPEKGAAECVKVCLNGN